MKLIEQENGQALVLLRKINRLKARENELEIELIKTPINKKRMKVSSQINKDEEELRKICTHNKTKVVHDYEPGSYYDRCKYINITMCEICGVEVKRDVTIGGYG
jgi:hypothetical protein